MAEINMTFYNAFIEVDGELTNIDVNDLFINVINKKSSKERTQVINDVYYSMPRMRPIDGKESNEGVYFWVGKFLTEKPYHGKIGSDTFQLMSDDPYSPCLVFYRQSDHLMGIQSKQYAPRRRVIEDFFNLYLQHEINGHIFQFVIYEQKDQSDLNTITPETEIKKILLEFEVRGYRRLALYDGKNQNNILSDLISQGVETSKECGVNLVHIEFKKGRFKKPIDYQVVDLMRQLDFKDSSLTSGKIEIKNPGKSVQTINLMNDGLLKSSFEIPKDANAFDVLAERLFEYVNSGDLPVQTLQYYVANLRNKVKNLDYNLGFVE